MNSACQRFFTKYKVEELKSKGISVSEGTLFTYKVKKRGDEIISTFEQIPRKHLTKDQWDQLYQEISEIHDNYDISDDY